MIETKHIHAMKEGCPTADEKAILFASAVLRVTHAASMAKQHRETNLTKEENAKVESTNTNRC